MVRRLAFYFNWKIIDRSIYFGAIVSRVVIAVTIAITRTDDSD